MRRAWAAGEVGVREREWAGSERRARGQITASERVLEEWMMVRELKEPAARALDMLASPSTARTAHFGAASHPLLVATTRLSPLRAEEHSQRNTLACVR